MTPTILIMFLVLSTQYTRKSSLQKKAKKTMNWPSWMSKSQKIRIALKHQYFEKIPTKASTQSGTAMFRIDTNKTWSGRYCTGDEVFAIVHSYEKKEFQKLLNLFEKNGFPLNYINRKIQHFLAKKLSKNQTRRTTQNGFL